MRTRASGLVGRDTELDGVRRVLGHAQGGKGSSLFLVGEAGIGKTRLAAEAVGQAFAAGMVVLRGRGSTLGPMVPFRPLTEALLSLVRRGELPGDAELGPYRPVLGRLVPDWGIDDGFGGASLVVLAEVAVAEMRWNRQFVRLSQAVLLGRAGRIQEADAAMAQAQSAAARYPLARHLGLRLVAESALEHGWGDPVAWLRQAEDYFHHASVPAVAGACRAALRRIGVPVSQHRTDSDRIPGRLRERGVTLREYEVYELLVARLGNKEIAARLHISPRTVEKHVASPLTKTDHTTLIADDPG
jgi:DNA-binding CsgD family transcriptional regulator